MADKKTSIAPLVGGLGAGFAIGFIIPTVMGGHSSVKISPNPVAKNATFTSTITGFPANTVLYGVATINATPWTVFEAGMTDGSGNLVASATAPSVAGTFPMIVFSTVGPKIAVTALTIV